MLNVLAVYISIAAVNNLFIWRKGEEEEYAADDGTAYSAQKKWLFLRDADNRDRFAHGHIWWLRGGTLLSWKARERSRKRAAQLSSTSTRYGHLSYLVRLAEAAAPGFGMILHIYAQHVQAEQYQHAMGIAQNIRPYFMIERAEPKSMGGFACFVSSNVAVVDVVVIW
jgi:hypothetical protein